VERRVVIARDINGWCLNWLVLSTTMVAWGMSQHRHCSMPWRCVSHHFLCYLFIGMHHYSHEWVIELLQRDWSNRIGKTNKQHPLYELQKALNLPETHSFGDTLDVTFMSVLENLKVIHEMNIVHRDCEFIYEKYLLRPLPLSMLTYLHRIILSLFTYLK
jgi:hypothetical protein